jgi:beta-lactamase regulating signal transducer with metallopeptidase domain/sporulation protein YlmC with PRC-barrel domain
MTAFANWFTPDVLRTLGLALAHFIWQGAAVGALSAVAIATARSASVRYIIGVAALALMVAAPVITYVILYDPSPVATANAEISSSPAMVLVGKLAAQPTYVGNVTSSGLLSGNALNWFVALWFAGVVLFSLRTAGGFFLVARLRHRDSKSVSAELLALCGDLERRLGITRAVRFCESLHLDAPAVLGWFRPVVFLPISALTCLSEAQLRAVIAHELAHIRRFDAFVNLFQVAVETLLFYHPAVWWLSRRIRAERENCCDDVALSLCGNPAEYARALALMEEWRVAPSFAMAANRGPLESRVSRLLGIRQQGSGLRNAGVAFGVLCLAAALVAGNALFGLVRTASAHPQVSPAPMPRESAIVITAPRPISQSNAKPESAPSQKSNSETSKSPNGRSYIDGLKSEGFDNLSADELISLKVQGITPEYIREIRAEGLKPDVDELVGMKVQGITPEYIHEVRAMKLNVDVESLIGMKVQGITPAFVDQMRKLGFQPDTEHLIGMKVQGITPEYVDQMRKLGFQPDTDQLIGMKVQGITPEYVHQLNELGIHPDAEDLIGMKVQGIDANYVRSIRETGISPDKDDWVALKVQGVTSHFVKSLQAAGFKPDVDEIVGAKVMGITPQFIELARSHGFKNLSLEKLIQLKHANVLE